MSKNTSADGMAEAIEKSEYATSFRIPITQKVNAYKKELVSGMTTHPVRGDHMCTGILDISATETHFRHTYRFATPNSMHGFRLEEGMIFNFDTCLVARRPGVVAGPTLYHSETFDYDEISRLTKVPTIVEDDIGARGARCLATLSGDFVCYREDFQEAVSGTLVVKKYDHVKYHNGTTEYYIDCITVEIPVAWLRRTLLLAKMIMSQMITPLTTSGGGDSLGCNDMPNSGMELLEHH